MKIELLGRKLSHSLSPQLHAIFADYQYNLRELEPEQLDAYFKKNDFDGLNITIPYKKDVMKYCDEISENAKKIGAVNTIYKRNGKLLGTNTDYAGFSAMLRKLNLSVKDKKVIILGSGGASLTAQTVCTDLGAKDIVIVSRKGEDNYSNIYEKHSDTQVIVNCTPVGMYPNTNERIINVDKFNNLEGVLDMIYNPSKTRLILDCESKNIPCCNGLTMLVVQGIKSAEMFLGHDLPESTVEKCVKKLEFDSCNITLVGMPGCGKSTVGKELAGMYNRPFLDTDSVIVQRESIDIPTIFAKKGEEYFRNLEEKVCFETTREKGQVIATGGGIILRKENREAIKSNSIVVFIKTDIESLCTDGRPLSKDKKTLKRMYNERLPLYDDVTDISVDLQETPKETADLIFRKITEYMK